MSEPGVPATAPLADALVGLREQVAGLDLPLDLDGVSEARVARREVVASESIAPAIEPTTSSARNASSTA
ncbi:MAG: hypothetical protein AAGK32_06100, partial [Actinomycetota bacterium]